MSSMDGACLDAQLREYEALRQEIALRTQEKHELMRYVLLLVSGIAAGVWSGTASDVVWQVSLLLVVPTISVLLSSMYSWHDEMIAMIACYLGQELIPKIRRESGRADLLGWESFLDVRRQGLGWKTKAMLMRAVFLLPIPISVAGYAVAATRVSADVVSGLLLTLNAVILLYMVGMFLCVDRAYLAAVFKTGRVRGQGVDSRSVADQEIQPFRQNDNDSVGRPPEP